MNHRRLSAVLLVVSVLAAVPAFASHSWGGYHWARTSNPFTVKLGNNLSSTWQTYLSTTSSNWSKSTVLDTAIVAGGTGGARRCPATAGRVEECNAKYGQNGWLGVASIWLASGTLHITQGTVKLNDTYFNMAQYNTPAWRNLVSCQETGHTFGLDHQDTTFDNVNLGTCMDYTNAPDGGVVNGFDYGPSNTAPNQHDYDELVTIYTHLDSTTTLQSGLNSVGAGLLVPTNTGLELAEPWQFGTPIGFDGRGRANVYAFQGSSGERVITFVLWANE